MKPVALDRRARAVIESQAAKRRLLETGGAVFGWEAEEALVVACASGPGPRAKHRPRRFAPARATTHAVMERIHETSAGRYAYLGSWHTHPLAPAVPSSVDKGTAEAMAGQVDLLLPRPLLLIVSMTGTSRRVRAKEIRAWRWELKLKQLCEADVEDLDLAERYCPAAALLFVE
jgi:integrative and conjugative element protein (TIGR02256 family)